MGFAKALCLNPDLGKYVRVIEIQTYALAGPRDTTVLGPDLHTVLGAALLGLPLHTEEREAWKSALMQCDISVPLALIATKAPFLRVLRTSHRQEILDRLFALRESDPSILSGLEQLHVGLERHEVLDYDIIKYSYLFDLPSLREYSFQEGNIYGHDCPSTWTLGSLKPQELALIHCECDASGIEKLVKACKTLTAFTFQNFQARGGSVNNHGPYPQEPTAVDIHEALLSHRETLRILQLDFWRKPSITHRTHSYQRFYSRRVKLPSRRNFPVLERIEIQHSLLPEAPEFSPALKSLHITDCDLPIWDMVANIARDCIKSQYPHFTDFLITSFDDTRLIGLSTEAHGLSAHTTPDLDYQSTRLLFEGTSVHFRIVPYDVDTVRAYLHGFWFDSDDDD
ncbi:hypothetical protein BJX66DRAFT_338825 [Aspergillus keveii]|uniref:F-box domain protein n=1 Tax=Aspergillus keveii TaxID=714993 RepID=A0ABR4G3B7_9EURO